MKLGSVQYSIIETALEQYISQVKNCKTKLDFISLYKSIYNNEINIEDITFEEGLIEFKKTFRELLFEIYGNEELFNGVEFTEKTYKKICRENSLEFNDYSPLIICENIKDINGCFKLVRDEAWDLWGASKTISSLFGLNDDNVNSTSWQILFCIWKFNIPEEEVNKIFGGFAT